MSKADVTTIFMGLWFALVVIAGIAGAIFLTLKGHPYIAALVLLVSGSMRLKWGGKDDEDDEDEDD
jgi:hypothetical protein